MAVVSIVAALRRKAASTGVNAPKTEALVLACSGPEHKLDVAALQARFTGTATAQENPAKSINVWGLAGGTETYVSLPSLPLLFGRAGCSTSEQASVLSSPSLFVHRQDCQQPASRAGLTARLLGTSG